METVLLHSKKFVKNLDLHKNRNLQRFIANVVHLETRRYSSLASKKTQ